MNIDETGEIGSPLFRKQTEPDWERTTPLKNTPAVSFIHSKTVDLCFGRTHC